MEKSKVLKYNNLPVRFPVSSTIVCAMALDYYDVPQWVIAVVGLWMAIVWAERIYRFFTEQTIDILENETEQF